MTNTLQKRFVVTAMIAISLLLTLLLGAVNVANIIIVNQRADRIMNVLTSMRGSYDPANHRQPQNGDNVPFPRRRLTPDDMMGARYFYVRFDAQGTITRTNIKHIYAVSEDQANAIALELRSGEPSGRYEQFQYETITLPEEKGAMMIFLDTSTQQESILSVLFISGGVGLLCWLVMLALVMLLSRQAIAPIAQNIEKQKQFVTNAGHEIKTPLAIILANTDAMELHNGENKWSRNIRTQSERLNELMKNLLALARMDEECLTLPMTQFSLDLLVEEAVELHREPAQAKQLYIASDIQSPLPYKGHWDSILQLVSVLLDNACKYTPEGGKVSLQLFREGSKTCLLVKNTCPEPPEQDLEKLFDRFYRGDAARTQSSGGFGIGLSAARSVAQAHGGTVNASYDKAEQVICFTVVL